MNTEMLNKLLELTVWLPIKGYDNYEVSICGQVRNSKTKRILRPRIRSGYYAINLCDKNEMKTFPIHRLVAKTFIPNLENKKCVDHINNNKLDNSISNLRWASYQDNSRNTSLKNNNTSGIKGVSYYKSSNKWEVKISFNNKKIHIGYFDNIEDAKIARQLKAKEVYAEFLNECEK